MMPNNQINNDELEIDLLEVFFELVTYIKEIALSTVLCGMIALVASVFLVTPLYESTAQLFVLSKSTSLTSLADIQMGSSLTKDYVVVVKGRPVLETVINKLGLEENYDELVEKVELNNPADSRILQITVTDPDPVRAKDIADTIADVSSTFIATKMDQDPPSIISYGYSDNDPVSPSIVKNSILGALIGFLLSAAIVVVSFLINDTIMTTDDVENKLGLHLLGTLPLEESEFDGDDDELTFKDKLKNI